MTVPESVIERVVERMERAYDPLAFEVAGSVPPRGLETSPALHERFAEVRRKTARFRAQKALTALYTALGEEGWKVVPREPTPEMAREPARNHVSAGDYTMSSFEAEEAWRYMLSAAPPPPGSGEVGKR